MKTEMKYRLNGRIVSIALIGLIMVCSSFLMFVYDPLQLILNRLLAMSPGTVFFNVWSTPPYDVSMNIYIFNLTNAEQFLNGDEKLNFSQVGPYTYKDILTNENAVFLDDGSVTFDSKRNFLMDPQKSAGDEFTDRITVPNVPLLGIAAYLQDSSFITTMGFSTIAATIGSQSILNITVNEFLWGYEDKLVSMANKFLPNWIDFGKFGLLERLLSRDKSNTVNIAVHPKQITTKYDYLLTEEERLSTFHILNWNGSPGLKEWGFEDTADDTKKCQLIEGAFEGTILPRRMRKERSLRIFRKAFCRPVDLEYSGESVTSGGFASYDYKMKNNMFASPEKNPDNECFCHNGKCPDKGLQSIAPCYYDIPVVLSQPHFLNVDRDVLETVNGMHPDEELHQSLARVQPDLGIPLDGSSLKIQVNLAIGQTKYNSKTRPFNGLTIPLFWIELRCDELPSLVHFLLRLVLDILPVAQTVLVYLLAFVGVAMISAAALLTLTLSKTSVQRSLSIASEYSPIPLIHIPAHYLKSELRISKQ